jgi:hypothetical protein
MSRLVDLLKEVMMGKAGMYRPGEGFGGETQGLFGTGGQIGNGVVNPRKSLLNLGQDFNKMNSQPGGLLGNIPQSALLGSAIFGQGVQGKDPFSALLPAVAQTAQLQQLMTPKDTRTSLQKELESAGYVPGTPEYNQAVLASNIKTESAFKTSPLGRQSNIDAATKNADYALGSLDYVTQIAGLTNKSPEAFGLKGKFLGFGKDVSNEIKGFYGSTLESTKNMGGLESSAYQFLGNPDFAGIQPLENALSIRIARTRNKEGKLMKDMITDAKDDASLQAPGGVIKVKQKLPYIFNEFLDTSVEQLRLSGKTPEEINAIITPYVEKFKNTLTQKTFKQGKDGVWIFE